MILAANGTSSAVDRTSGGDAGWESLWLSGTQPSAYTTTLADVRAMIGADTGWASSLTGKGVGVALIDTGVAPVPGIPAAKVQNGPDLSFESQSEELIYLDGFGHGTHLAGIIVGDDAATGTKGLAPDVKLTSIKVGTANGAVDISQMIAAIDWVVKHRNDDPANPIRVLNISYASGALPEPWWNDPLQFAVEQAWKANIVVVVAGGNGGADKMAEPSNDQWVLAVGSTTTQGTRDVRDDTIASYTNVGGSRMPDVLAPGDSVASLRVPGSNVDNTFPGARVGDTLFKGTGTSQAAAITSAGAALLLQFWPWLTASQVKQFLIDGKTWLPNGRNGMGELNINGAITKLMERPNANCQNWTWLDGKGSIDAGRGGVYVKSGGKELRGEVSIFGSFNSTEWSAKSATHTSWDGGSWMGYRMAGDGWTGTSWASKTWGSAKWDGQPWDGSTSWNDKAWIGRYWSGKQWSPGDWTGRYWSNDFWASSYWE